MGTTLTYTLLAVALSASFHGAAYAWTPGVGNESATSGFSVDRQSRSDVVSFWHAIYQESEGYEDRINWTGLSGGPGTTSSAFKGDVQRRINYYRAMAGMDANMGMNTGSTVLITGETPSEARPSASITKGAAAQAAAYMVSKNTDEYLPGGGVDQGDDNPHNPPPSWSDDGSTARNGAFYSNLASSFYGPGAIDEYIQEGVAGAGGNANTDVAHRRLIFYSRRAEFATGDVTLSDSGGNLYFAANALYSAGNILAVPTPQFVTWPSAGFFPEPLATKYWSLSYPGADFSSATVSMTHVTAGSVNVSVVARSEVHNYGDKSLVWEPSAAQLPSAVESDQTYQIVISNILVDGQLISHSYSVTVMNPDRLDKDLVLDGSLNPPDTGARYFFDAVELAEEYELDISKRGAVTWGLGAESEDVARVIDGTDASYELESSFTYNSSSFWDVGSKAYRLAFPVSQWESQEQNFRVSTTLLPQTGAKVAFRMRRGIMQSFVKLRIQSSVNGGVSWVTLKDYPGRSDTDTDDSFSTKEVTIPSVDQDTLIRFNLYHPDGGGVFNVAGYSQYPVGVFIDEVTFVNCDEFESVDPANYSSSASWVELDALAAEGALVVGDTYTLRLRARMGNHWFPYGPVLNVTPVAESTLASYESWVRSEYHFIGDFDQDYDGDGISNGVERVFGLNPTDNLDAAPALKPTIVNGNLQLSHSVIPGGNVEAELSYTLEPGSWQVATVVVNDDVATVSVPINAPACYLRWKVNQ